MKRRNFLTLLKAFFSYFFPFALTSPTTSLIIQRQRLCAQNSKRLALSHVRVAIELGRATCLYSNQTRCNVLKSKFTCIVYDRNQSGWKLKKVSCVTKSEKLSWEKEINFPTNETFIVRRFRPHPSIFHAVNAIHV